MKAVSTATQIDWLTINFKGEVKDGFHVSVKKLEYGCRTFRNIHECYLESELIGVITSAPTSSVLPSDLIQFKIDNRLLYTESFWDKIKLVAKRLCWQWVGISRIDLCRDFQVANDGSDPALFIKKFLSGEIVPCNRCSFQINGKFRKLSDYNYIRIGSRSSVVQARLYNKSQEMRDGHRKLYIEDVWSWNGFDENVDTWRLEFQVGSDFKAVVNKDSGELIVLDETLITMQGMLDGLFDVLNNRYFRFKVVSEDSNKSRWQDYFILPTERMRTRRWSEVKESDETRSQRIFAARLVEYFNRECSDDWMIQYGTYNGIASWLNRHKLTAYLIKRGVYLNVPTPNLDPKVI